MIHCPVCETASGDSARFCAKCGHALNAQMPPTRQRVQTTERTGKSWKLLMILGGLGLIVSLIGCFVAASERTNGPETSNDDGAVWGLVFVASLLMYVFARLGAWWYHG